MTYSVGSFLVVVRHHANGAAHVEEWGLDTPPPAGGSYSGDARPQRPTLAPAGPHPAPLSGAASHCRLRARARSDVRAHTPWPIRYAAGAIPPLAQAAGLAGSWSVSTIRESAVHGKTLWTMANELGRARNTVRKYQRSGLEARPYRPQPTEPDSYKK